MLITASATISYFRRIDVCLSVSSKTFSPQYSTPVIFDPSTKGASVRPASYAAFRVFRRFKTQSGETYLPPRCHWGNYAQSFRNITRPVGNPDVISQPKSELTSEVHRFGDCWPLVKVYYQPSPRNLPPPMQTPKRKY